MGILGLVLVRYRYRLYPSPGQRQSLARVFGCARVVHNDCLRLREECHAADERISETDVQRRVITLARLTPERKWLAQAPSVALVQACNDARRLTGITSIPAPASARPQNRPPGFPPQARPPIHPAHPQRVRPAR